MRNMDVARPLPTRKSSRRKWKLLAGFSLLLVLIAVFATISVLGQRKKAPVSPFSPSLIAAVPYTIYYPSKLPKGYTFLIDSVRYESPILSYKVQGASGQVLTFVIQAKPTETFDFKRELASTSDYEATIGHVYIVDSARTMTAVIVGSRTWINVSLSEKIDTDLLKEIFNSMIRAE